jgi:hypothetical protein
LLNKMKRTLPMLSKSMLIMILGVSLIAPNALAAAEQGTTQAIPLQNSSSSALNPADAKFSKDQAVELTRKLFPSLKDATVQSVDFGDPNTYPPRNEKVWTIQWQVKTENGSSGFSSRVDALNGDLLQVYLPNINNDARGSSHYPPKISKEEALQRAKLFVSQAAPSISQNSLFENEDVKLYNGQMSLFGPIQYNFSFTVKINNVPSRDSAIQVTLDGDGNVTQFNKSQQVGNYPSAEPKITKEQAAQFAKQHQEAELQYIPIRKPGGKVESWWLGYLPSLQPIDAQTGQFVSLGMNSHTYVPVPKKDKVYTPISTKGEITAEQAAQIVEGIFPKLAEMKLQQKSLYDNWRGDGHKVWSLLWGEADQRPGYPGSNRATVDAQTGVVLDYSKDNYGPYPPVTKPVSQEPAITKEAAKQRTEELINLLYPNASEELKLQEIMNDESTMDKPPLNNSYIFQRFYNGVLVSGDSVNVSLDLQGNVTNYYANKSVLDDKALGALKVNVSNEQALNQIWANVTFDLQYNLFGGYPANNPNEQPVVKLVYNQILKNSNLNLKALDATDSTWKPVWSWQPDNLQASMNPTDITGHWAQKDLETLLQYQVLTPDNSGKLNPDQTITKGDWLTMMAAAVTPQYKNYYFGNSAETTLFADVNPDSPYYHAVRMFVQQKWLTADANKKLELDQALTREELASSLVRIVKYNKLSNLLAPFLITLPYSDSDQITNKSEVSLTVELGLMQSTDGAFKPLGKVTKAEVASVLMRLVSLQGKLDQLIGQ